MPGDPTPPTVPAPGEPAAEGLGAPASGQPTFVPAAPAAAHGPSTGPDPLPGPAWAAPHPATRIATPPVGRPPRQGRPGRRMLVAAAVASGLLLTGVLSALPLVPRTPAPSPSPSVPPVVVTATPSATTGADRVLAGGGDLGRPVAFTTDGGAGTITVTAATWTDAGEAPPVAGQRYLVLEVGIACTGGEVAVDPLLLLATAGGEQALPGFGPRLDRPLAGTLLAPGEQAAGQVGFALPPGPVQVHLLNEVLQRLATVEVPAP